MKYFAKYLPVEEEIKEGDSIIYEGYDGISTRHNKRGRGVLTKGGIKLTKLKLFLCSRDIQVGDKARSFKYPEFGEREVKEFFEAIYSTTVGWSEVGVHKEELYKVIGDISPNALLYVKEDDEFDEEEIEYYWHNTIIQGKRISHSDYEKSKTSLPYSNILIKIKGPCGHFH